MRAAIGSQCKLMNRGLTCALFGSLKINIAATFWINCRGLMELAEDLPREHCNRLAKYSTVHFTVSYGYQNDRSVYCQNFLNKKSIVASMKSLAK